MKNQHIRQVVELNIATLFISTSGALGKFIDMPTPVIIWWRCFLAVMLLYFYCRYRRARLQLHYKKDIRTFVVSALFLGAHWITYFYALKLSNVAIGMLSLFTFPIITALLEPLFVKVKFDPMHLLLGVVVLLGIYILAPEFDLSNNDFKGVVLGIISATFYSMRTLLLKQHVANYNGTVLMFYQVLILTIVLVPALFLMDTTGIQTQYPYVILLAVLTTAIGHTMFISSLKYFKVSTASIIASMQPIFGILIAYIFLNEIPTLNTFFGGLLIISTVIIESLRSQKTTSS